MRRRSKVAIACIIIAAVGIFGYSQFVLATHLHVSILASKVIQKTNDGTLYDMTLQFSNPSLLILSLGQTDFVVTIDGQKLGTGTLQPSIIPSIGNTISKTPFLADNALIAKYDKSDNIPNVKLTGTTKYDLLVASVNIPFTYYPTQAEAREFIHGT